MTRAVAERVRGQAHWAVVAGGTAVVVVALVSLWRLVEPVSTAVCPAIWPAPPGCADRMPPTAAAWTAGLIAAVVAVVVVVALSGRRRFVVAVAGSLTLLLAAAVGYRATLLGL